MGVSHPRLRRILRPRLRRYIPRRTGQKGGHALLHLRSRLVDAKLFADFARKEGFDVDARAPYGKMAEFLKQTCASPLSPKDLRRGKDALRRALKFYASGVVTATPVGAMSEPAGARYLRYWRRGRCTGHQGRPQ